MKILLSVGHSLLRNGYYTSADGRPFGGVLEYTYNKNIVGEVATYLRQAGHTVDVLTCPESVFVKSSEEKAYKVPKANAGGYNLVAELHLNASNLHNSNGCSVLYASEKGKEVALKIVESLSKVFRNLGAQKRTNLYMLNSVKPTSVIIESFFCDSSKDCEIAKKENVALRIAEGINGGQIDVTNNEDKPKESAEASYLFRFRTTVSELNIRKGPGTEYERTGSIKDRNVYTIVETKKSRDGGIWGRLKSGVGWVNVSEKYINRL